MFVIEEVKTKRQMKQFVDFANDLYKNVPQYVPPIYGDEVGLISVKTNPSLNTCTARFWMCKDKNGNVVGRIGAILQPVYNERVSGKFMRFTRFDVIDNIEITKLLFDEVLKYAREEGMEKIHGPLGFNDFEREGLVVQGFQYRVTSSNEYNFPYYMEHLEKLGFVKEADWFEYRLLAPDAPDERYEKLAKYVGEKYKLHDGTIGLSTGQIVSRYADKIFDLLNECYGELHGYVYITKEVQKQLAASFRFAVKNDFISLILDENDELIALGIALSSMSKPLKTFNGHLFPFGFIPMLFTLQHPKELELAFIAVKENYRRKGVHVMVMNKLMNSAVKWGIHYAESNCILEYNEKMRNIWEKWDHVNHRKRRCYVLNDLPKESFTKDLAEEPKQIEAKE